MKERKFFLKNARITPRKARELKELLVGQDVSFLLAQLKALGTERAKIIAKLIASGAASIRNEKKEKIEDEEIFVSRYIVEEGMKLKRQLVRSRGRAAPLLKRRSHLHIYLTTKDNKGKQGRTKEKNGTKSQPS